jgi:hypothetical protein
MKRLSLAVVVAAFFVPCSAHHAGEGRTDRKDPAWLLPLPELQRDPKVPTLKDVVGHAWGEDVSSHAEIERYLKALAAAAPARARLEAYGKSHEGRTLYTLIISSPDNLKRLEEIRKDNLALADPRKTPPEQADDIARKVPAVVWLAYCVHGNETSPSDAALVTAYHLLADRRPDTRALLDRLVVILDPLQNPDGRDRFVNFHRETRGTSPQAEPLASDRLERWPGGRFNHYLFDMNRDWFLQTQQESRARVAAYLRWQPQIFVDAHEMGPGSTFFFDPPADPVSPFILARQRDWYMKVGKHHAKRFDQYGFSYTTREMFDAFVPQYGSTWPTLHGSIGILWEQAGVRGTVIDRKDETRLHYHNAVRHHYVSGLATLEAAAETRAVLLRDFYQNRADSIQLGRTGPVRDYFLLEGDRPARAARLAQLLVRNGIEVRRVPTELKLKATDTLRDKPERHLVPAGSYHISLNQPAASLARSLLDRHVDMGKDFIKRQLDRAEQGLRDEIYDITAWSLPLGFGVRCLATDASVTANGELIAAANYPGEVVGDRASVAYLVQGEDDAAPLALCDWLRAGLRVHVAGQPFKLNGVSFGKGSLILKVADNAASLHEAVKQAARQHGVRVHAASTGFVTEGAGLGGPHVRWVKPPQVLLMVDRPAMYTVGHTWYLFDQVWRYPVTRVAGRNLGSVDLRKYNVLILPDGLYSFDSDAPGEATVGKIRDWVRQGGTLILVKGAAAWASGDKVKLLAGKPEQKPPPADEVKSGLKGPKALFGEPGQRAPGVFLRATVHDDHWVTYGVQKTTNVFFAGTQALTPLKRPEGRNLVSLLDDGERLLASGFCWPKMLPKLTGKAYAVHQPVGSGHVIAFADDPNFRAMAPESQRLFLNAVLYSPGH